MDIINSLLNDLDLTALVPELDSLTFWLQTLLRMAAIAGPVTLLIMGIIYVVAPPKEATHKAGYRTYFGMGSIQAWRFSQFYGGAVIALLGLVLTIISMVTSGGYGEMPMMEAALSAIALIKGQIISAAIIYVVLFIAMAVLFDRSGNCRFSFRIPFYTPVAPAVQEAPVAEQEEEQYVQEEFAPEFYTEETTAPLRVEDIVIEGITDEESVF